MFDGCFTRHATAAHALYERIVCRNVLRWWLQAEPAEADAEDDEQETVTATR